MELNRRVLALLLISFLGVTGTLVVLFYLPSGPTYSPLESDLFCNTDLSVTVDFPEVFMFGDDINLSVSLSTSEIVTLNEIAFTVSDGAANYTERFQMTADLGAGDSLLENFLLGVSVDDVGRILVLRPGEYMLQSVTVSYFGCLSFQSEKYMTTSPFTIQDHPVEERASDLSWNSTSPFSQEGLNLTFLSSFQPRRVNLTSSVDLTGIFYASVQTSGVERVALYLNGSLVANESSSMFSFNVAQYVGTYEMMVALSLKANTSISFSLSLPTRRVIVLAAVIDDQWSSSFQPVEYYMKEVNARFVKQFNLSIVITNTISVLYNGSSDIYEFVDFGRNVFGDTYNTQPWIFGSVIETVNLGINMLLLLTNKTMSHYGVVLGDSNGPYNLALNAGGSELAGGLRLSSAWGDNLIQHEISHVFGALDRYSSQDPPSVMTKPENTNEVLKDISQGTLWLTLTNWLPADLFLMSVIISRMV